MASQAALNGSTWAGTARKNHPQDPQQNSKSSLRLIISSCIKNMLNLAFVVMAMYPLTFKSVPGTGWITLSVNIVLHSMHQLPKCAEWNGIYSQTIWSLLRLSDINCPDLGRLDCGLLLANECHAVFKMLRSPKQTFHSPFTWLKDFSSGDKSELNRFHLILLGRDGNIQISIYHPSQERHGDQFHLLHIQCT